MKRRTALDARQVCALFACILFVGCNPSTASSTPTTSTATIPSATATTSSAPSAEPTTTPSATHAEGDPCGIPPGWPVQQGLSMKTGEVVVLAWRQKVDDRPLYVDEALVWQKTPNGGYTLNHMYRHPKEENEFRPSVVCDAPIQPWQSFDHAPSNKDVKDFLKQTTWPHELTDFKQTGGAVCTDNWARVIGAPPPTGILGKSSK